MFLWNRKLLSKGFFLSQLGKFYPYIISVEVSNYKNHCGNDNDKVLTKNSIDAIQLVLSSTSKKKSHTVCNTAGVTWCSFKKRHKFSKNKY